MFNEMMLIYVCVLYSAVIGALLTLQCTLSEFSDILAAPNLSFITIILLIKIFKWLLTSNSISIS